MTSKTNKTLELPLQVFYSYAHEDEKLRKKLEDHLSIFQRQGLIAGWNDRDISAGTEWEKDINEHIESANIILLLISSDFIASDFCYGKEMEAALKRHKAGSARVVPVIMRDVYWRGAPFSNLQALPTDGKPVAGSAWNNQDEAFTDVAGGIHKVIYELTANPLADPNLHPYKGLFAFQEADVPYFYGRETFTDKLVDEVHKKPLVAVIGPSGSGKSSVVFAGLVPRLRKEGYRHVITYRPGEDPRKALSAALVPALEPHMTRMDRLNETAKMESALRDGTVTLADIINEIVRENPETPDLLLIADQFEELYTLCKDPKEQQSHIDALLETFVPASGEATPNLRLVITMRSDFLGHAQSYRSLNDALQDADVKLGPMTIKELREAIEKPAANLGVQIEDGLTERILDDVSERPGSLPLLEFALRELWERRSFGKITHAAYDEIGGVEEALASYAEQVYKKLSPDDQQHVQRIFTRLVRPGEGAVDTRRVASQTEIGEENWGLVTRLADARLVVSGRDEASGQDAVEVVHEALIGGWSRLRGWVETDRAFLTWRERLLAAMRQWQTSNKDEGALLRGAPLAEAEGWLEERQIELNEDERGFILAGVELRERERSERERERIEREQLRRRVTLAAIGAAIVFLVLAVLSGTFWLRSEEQRRIALSRQLVAQVQTLAANALTQLEVDPELSLLLAMEAISTTQRVGQPNVPEAEDALRRALLTPLLTTLGGNEGAVRSATYSRDGNSIVTTNISHTIPVTDSLIKIWDARTGKNRALVLVSDGKVYNDAAYSPYGRRIIGAADDGSVTMWDADTGKIISSKLDAHKSKIYALAFSPLYGHRIVTASADHTAKIWEWNAKTGLGKVEQTFLHDSEILSAEYSLDGHIVTASADGRVQVHEKNPTTGEWRSGITLENKSPVNSAVFGPSIDPSNGHTILTASADGAVRLWNTQDGSKVDLLPSNPTWPAVSVAYSPEVNKIVAGTVKGVTKVWDANTKQEIATINGHYDDVLDVHFSPDGKRIVTASADTTAKVWSSEGGYERPNLVGHEGFVVDAVWSHDDTRVVSTSRDGTARVWDPETGKELAVLRDHKGDVKGAAFSPTEDLIATASDDKTVIVWQKSKGSNKEEEWEPIDTLRGHEGWVNSVAFSPNGDLIATASDDKTVIVWQKSKQSGQTKWQRIATLQGSEAEVNSVDFSLDGSRIVAAGNDHAVRIWERASDKQPMRLIGHNDPVTSVEYSRDGKHIVSASWDNTARVWDAETGELIRTLKGHTKVVHRAAFSPDGKSILTASADSKVKLWETQTGQELVTLHGHSDRVLSARWSHTGRFILTASIDKTARQYFVSITALMDAANTRVTRGLNADERDKYLGNQR